MNRGEKREREGRWKRRISGREDDEWRGKEGKGKVGEEE